MKPPLDPLSANIDGISQPQLRRLLLLASGSSSRLADVDDLDDARQQIEVLLARLGIAEINPLAEAVAAGTSLDELRRIKDVAKRLLSRAETPGEQAAARLLYHVAVATAFGRDATEISSAAMAQRSLLYERLALVFAGDAVGEAFHQAVLRARESGPA